MTRKNVAIQVMFLTMCGTAVSWARGNEEPDVLVRLIDAGQVPQPLMMQAKVTAEKILASAGVRLSWGKIGCGSEGAVEIIDLRFAYFTPAKYHPGALAQAHPY